VLHGARQLSLFLLLLRQIISRRHLLLHGNPGPPTVCRTQEQRRRPLFFRCSPLFWLEQIQEPQQGNYPPDLSFFLLSRVSALGNYCCEAPVGQDETVYVFTEKEVKITYDPLRIFKIVGVFEAGMRSDPTNGPSLFRVRNARVEEALGAKIFKVGEIPAPAPKP